MLRDLLQLLLESLLFSKKSWIVEQTKSNGTQININPIADNGWHTFVVPCDCRVQVIQNGGSSGIIDAEGGVSSGVHQHSNFLGRYWIDAKRGSTLNYMFSDDASPRVYYRPDVGSS